MNNLVNLFHTYKKEGQKNSGQISGTKLLQKYLSTDKNICWTTEWDFFLPSDFVWWFIVYDLRSNISPAFSIRLQLKKVIYRNQFKRGQYCTCGLLKLIIFLLNNLALQVRLSGFRTML